MAFAKGVSGNPLGNGIYKNKPVSFLARHHAPQALKVLVDISKDKNAPHASRVTASMAVLDRAWGKPPSFSSSDPQTFKRAVDMTDDELAAIASGAVLTLVPK